MANANAPYGFRPLRRIDGGIPGRNGNDYTIADALASNIGIGSLVKRTGTGKNIDLAPDGVGGACAVGVFLGCSYRDARGNRVYSPNWISGTTTFGAEGGQAVIVDDPKVIFKARMSAGFTATDSGQFAGLVAGSVNSLGFSTSAVNSADITGTLDNFKILGLVQNAPNAYGNYAEVEILIAFHEYGDGTLRAS